MGNRRRAREDGCGRDLGRRRSHHPPACGTRDESERPAQIRARDAFDSAGVIRIAAGQATQPRRSECKRDADDGYLVLESPSTLPPQTQKNIGDLLSDKGVSWAWYAGAWNATTKAAQTDRKFASPTPNFQFHHQPFNYFANMDPVKYAAYRAEHLKDFDSSFLQDAAAGKLPAVTFYKPQGNLNQHAGYADVA